MATRSRWRPLVLPVAVATLVAGLVVGGLLWAGRGPGGGGAGGPAVQARAASQGYGSAPAYTLTDQTGHLVSSARFRGKVQVVGFLFPYCTTDCPVLARDLAQLQHALAARGLGDKVEIVTFNVDPSGAGPKQLAEFLGQYGAEADPAKAGAPWYYLTGSPRQVKQVVRDGYHVAYWKVKGEEEGVQQPNPLAERVDPGYDIKHTDAVYIVDPSGKIRTFFGSTADVTAGRLLDAARKALS